MLSFFCKITVSFRKRLFFLEVQPSDKAEKLLCTDGKESTSISSSFASTATVECKTEKNLLGGVGIESGGVEKNQMSSLLSQVSLGRSVFHVTALNFFLGWNRFQFASCIF